jgi:hypothetical protein
MCAVKQDKLVHRRVALLVMYWYPAAMQVSVQLFYNTYGVITTRNTQTFVGFQLMEDKGKLMEKDIFHR